MATMAMLMLTRIIYASPRPRHIITACVCRTPRPSANKRDRAMREYLNSTTYATRVTLKGVQIILLCNSSTKTPIHKEKVVSVVLYYIHVVPILWQRFTS